MKKLCAFVVVMVLCVMVFGLYRGWFAFSSGRQPESNKVDVSFTVDPDKLHEDAAAVREKASELTDKVTEKVTDSEKPPLQPAQPEQN